MGADPSVCRSDARCEGTRKGHEGVRGAQAAGRHVHVQELMPAVVDEGASHAAGDAMASEYATRSRVCESAGCLAITGSKGASGG